MTAENRTSVKVVLTGPLAILAGCGSADIELAAPALVTDLTEALVSILGPQAEQLLFDAKGDMSLTVLVNGRHAEMETPILEGDVVAYVLPLSGG